MPTSHNKLTTLGSRKLSKQAPCVKAISKSNIDSDYSQELIACRENIFYWIDNYVFTYDPRVQPAIIPFKLFPRQKEYLEWRKRICELRTNGLVEKSRDVGLTWLNVVAQLHSWLFVSGFKGAFGSRKEMLVDRIGDIDSIFEKARFVIQHLPEWMLPKGFDFKQHSHHCKLINPANKNSITGESGSNIGRGGRSTVYDLDEAAFVQYPQKVDAALSNNTNSVIYTSSANGIGNPFYQKRMSYPQEYVFRFHWRDDPRKDDAWYQGMKQKYDPVIIASEIDLDYTASVEGIFIPSIWVQAAVELEIPPRGDRIAGLDVALSGKNLNVFLIRQGAVVSNIEHWSNLNTTQTAYKVRDLAALHKCNKLNFDADGVGAGVAGTLGTEEKLKFKYTPIHGGGRPSDREWIGEQRTSVDKFANKRAELWGLLRERFRKTYNYVNHVADYPLDELISIPNHPTLITQLSSPLGKMTNTGKTLIESKQDMLKRGISSPDFADALAYTEEVPKPFYMLMFS